MPKRKRAPQTGNKRSPKASKGRKSDGATSVRVIRVESPNQEDSGLFSGRKKDVVEASILDDINELKGGDGASGAASNDQDDSIFDVFSQARSGSAVNGRSGDGDGDEDEEEDDVEDEDPVDSEEGIELNSRAAGMKPASAASSKQVPREELINVDFEFCDPRETDYQALCLFLSKWLGGDGAASDAWLRGHRELADIVCRQATVGTVIRADDSEDSGPLAFLTAISLSTHRDAKCVQCILDHVASKAPASAADRLGRMLAGGKVTGLLIQDRLINLPHRLVPALHAEFSKDLLWARKNEDTPALRKSFQFDRYLYLTRSYVQEGDDADTRWFKIEDDIMERHADFSFSFDLAAFPKGSKGVDMLRQRQVVMVISAARMKPILKKIKKLVGGA